MHMIVGLGNPGQKYARNRHNVGFMAIDAIAQTHNFGAWQSKFNALLNLGHVGNERALLVKPQTFMNMSGQAVGEAIRFYKLDVSAISVIYDELDLAPGKVRTKRGGGHGGHNGIKSLDAHCGKDYRRVRIGIGHPGDKARVNSHVLGDFARSDAEWLDPLLEGISSHIGLLFADRDSQFLNKLSAGSSDSTPQTETKAKTTKSHIRQARPTAKQSGVMAEFLSRWTQKKSNSEET